MKISRGVGASAALMLLLTCAAMPLWADNSWRDAVRNADDQRGDDRRDDDHRGDRRDDDQRDDKHRGNNRKGDKHRADDDRDHKRGYVRDNRYQHDRYYPPHGHVVQTLPPRYHEVPHHGTRYYFSEGVWYQPARSRYVVVTPPVGLRISFLPSFYTTIWVGGLPIYYADGVYYNWQPQERTYVVTNPPPDDEVYEQPTSPDQLFVYPQKGQGEQQQATDRYLCHNWSVGQTDFDPTQPSGKVSSASYEDKRSDYQRAMRACLEARGYSVQ